MPSFFPDPTFELPPFNSLLAVGSYHSTAPIHLAISYATENPDSCPIVLSPSKAALKDGLKAFGDHHVASGARRGNMLETVSRIQMLYPPTPVHMALLLSMLRCSREEDPETTLYSLRTIANRTYPPGLIIIHEPSLYFTDADELSPHTLSSYLNLLVRAFSACRSLSSSGSPQQAYLVVFDSRLLELKLPLTRPPQSEMYRYQPTHTSEIKAVFESAEKLFEWVAYFELGEDEDTIPSSQGEDDEMTLLHTPAKQMRLCRVGSEYAEVFHWEEVVRMDKYNSQPSIHFVFKE